MPDTLTLQQISPVTHDTHHLVFDRPEGFDFTPGQATHMALDRDGWRDEDRPFTMTSQPGDPMLEFIIKSYPSHNGVTQRIGMMNKGDRVLAEKPAGAISDHGPGVFIAGGAGITPFIPILRKRAKDSTLDGCDLIFANKTEDDIILRDEWNGMTGLRVHLLVSDAADSNLQKGRIDKDYLRDTVSDFDRWFYLCGPQDMVDDVRISLKALGALADRIITEKGW